MTIPSKVRSSHALYTETGPKNNANPILQSLAIFTTNKRSDSLFLSTPLARPPLSMRSPPPSVNVLQTLPHFPFSFLYLSFRFSQAQRNPHTAADGTHKLFVRPQLATTGEPPRSSRTQQNCPASPRRGSSDLNLRFRREASEDDGGMTLVTAEPRRGNPDLERGGGCGMDRRPRVRRHVW